MNTVNAIKEVAECLEKPEMRHFFDKKKKMVILSSADDEMVDFIKGEIDRLASDVEHYAEINRLSEAEIQKIFEDFVEVIDNKAIREFLSNNIREWKDFRDIDKLLHKLDDSCIEYHNWCKFKAQRLEKLAADWLQQIL